LLEKIGIILRFIVIYYIVESMFLFLGSIIFLSLFVGLALFIYFKFKDKNNDNSNTGEGDGEGDGEEVKTIKVFKCYGSNFNRPQSGFDSALFDKSCHSDHDFQWSSAVSCDLKELSEMVEKNRVACPPDHSFIEGPVERPGEKCKNGDQAYGFKCFNRKGYYDHDPNASSFYSAIKALECCSGQAEKNGKKCSGRFCPGSNLCYTVLHSYCKKEANRGKEACLNFCSREDSGFPKESPQEKIIKLNSKFGIVTKIVKV
jgi:hypothetical protein